MQGKHRPAVLPFLRSPAVRCETMSRLWHYQAGDEPVHRRMMVRSRPLVLPYLLVPAHYPPSAARRAERSLTGSKRRAQAVRLPFDRRPSAVAPPKSWCCRRVRQNPCTTSRVRAAFRPPPRRCDRCLAFVFLRHAPRRLVCCARFPTVPNTVQLLMFLPPATRPPRPVRRHRVLGQSVGIR